MDESRIERRFAKSYRPAVHLGGNKNCSLKRHFFGGLHEVVGYLDFLASRHPESRFVYASIADIIEHCRKFDSKTKYNKRWINYALEYLRLRHIVSARLVRLCDGQMREGFIVAPHQHVTVLLGATQCRYVGMAAPFDCWHQLPTGEVFWVDPADPNRHKLSQIGDEQCTPQCTPECTHRALPSALHSALPSPELQCTPEPLQVSDDTIDTS